MTELDRLRAEVEALRVERDEARQASGFHARFVVATECLKTGCAYYDLRAEVEGARETLRLQHAVSYNAKCEGNALRTCVRQLVGALRACGHDSGCHPSEGWHSDVCREQRAALAAAEKLTVPG